MINNINLSTFRKLISNQLQANLSEEKKLNEANIASTWDKLQKVIQYLGETEALDAITKALDDFTLNETLNYIIKMHNVPMPNEMGDQSDINPGHINNSGLSNYLNSPEGLNETN